MVGKIFITCRLRGLDVPSYVRIHKLTALAKAEVVRGVGPVSDRDRESLNLILCSAFYPRTEA